MVPLFILCTYKPKARNPRNVHIAELFTTPPDKEHGYFSSGPESSGTKQRLLTSAFLLVDRVFRMTDFLIPRAMRAAATKRAENWFLERLNGEDGLGAIFPAMVNALEAMVLLGYPKDDPRRVTAKRALEKLLVINNATAYCQPCVSPIWDSALAALAVEESGDDAARDASTRALDWLRTKQLLDQPGDWRVRKPDLPGGGWAFQFANDFYPDLD